MTPTIEEISGWLREAAFMEACLVQTHEERCRVKKKWEGRAAQVEAMGWRPIEEAPKDGTKVIGLVGGLVYTCSMVAYVNYEPSGSGSFVDNGDRRYGWSRETADAHTPCSPTNFMPLPQPPVKK